MVIQHTKLNLKTLNKILFMMIFLFVTSCASHTVNIAHNTKTKDESSFLFYNSEDYVKTNEISEKLFFPVKGLSLPERKNLLPNAQRKYRNGIHRGIDIIVSYNTPVYATFDGIIIYENDSYQDVSLDLYNIFLEKTNQLKRTPSDLYNHILLGKHIIIDHGYDFLPKYRTTSIYAHLSQIDQNIKVGLKVKKGELIGYVGNSGTKYGAMNNTLGAHLHWEVHFENEKNKYYLGENIESEDFINTFKKIIEENKNEN